MDNKIKILNEICFKYVAKREEHYRRHWLSIRAVVDRMFAKLPFGQPDSYVTVREKDFEFTNNMESFISEIIQTNNISCQ